MRSKKRQQKINSEFNLLPIKLTAIDSFFQVRNFKMTVYTLNSSVNDAKFEVYFIFVLK